MSPLLVNCPRETSHLLNPSSPLRRHEQESVSQWWLRERSSSGILQTGTSQSAEGRHGQAAQWLAAACCMTDEVPILLVLCCLVGGDQSRRQCKYYVCAWHEHLYVWIYKIIHTTYKQAYILRLAHTKCYTISNLEILWVFVLKNILAMYDVVLISTLLKWVISEVEINLVKQGVGGDRQRQRDRDWDSFSEQLHIHSKIKLQCRLLVFPNYILVESWHFQYSQEHMDFHLVINNVSSNVLSLMKVAFPPYSVCSLCGVIDFIMMLIEAYKWALLIFICYNPLWPYLLILSRIVQLLFSFLPSFIHSYILMFLCYGILLFGTPYHYGIFLFTIDHLLCSVSLNFWGISAPF